MDFLDGILIYVILMSDSPMTSNTNPSWTTWTDSNKSINNLKIPYCISWTDMYNTHMNKLTSDHKQRLKMIIARQYGAAGCDVAVTQCVLIIKRGLAEVRLTQAGIDYIAEGKPISPERIESWVRGFKLADSREAARIKRIEEAKSRDVANTRERERSIREALELGRLNGTAERMAKSPLTALADAEDAAKNKA